MKTKLLHLALALSLFPSAAISGSEKSTTTGAKVDNFTLQDFRGKTHQLSDYRQSKIVVLAFLGTECPLVRFYGPRLEALANQYQKKGVQILGINSNSQDSVTEIAAYARRHEISFPILKDLQNKLADAVQAKRTPEVFVLDQNRIIRYRGRIDDQYGVGVVRDDAKHNYLKAALDDLLSGKKVKTPRVEAVGCIIGRVHQAKRESKVTYSNQIARILQNRCVECHRSGEIAPFALTKYEEVAGWAEMIAEVVDEGRMPPWHAHPKYGKFSNERRLTSEEKQQIFTWVKNGAPRGNPKDLPKPKSYVSGWQLPREPDVVLNIQKSPVQIQAQGAIRYKYYRVDPGFKEDKWVRGAQIVPGNRAVVHHILTFAVPKTPGGFLGRIGEGRGGFLAGYVPGQRAYVFPEGMAKKIPANHMLVFQVHYTPVGTEQLDQSKIGFLFADPKTITHEVKTRAATQRRLSIPPNDANHKVVATSGTVPNSYLLGFMPHMHLRGKAFRYEAIYPDGKKEILMDVPAYDFNWQTSYRLAKPRILPSGTRIHSVAHYDNSEDNLNNPDPTKTVHWGPQTWHEMMIGYFDIAIPKQSSAAQKRTKLNPDPAASQKVRRFFNFLDKNGDGKIVRSEVPARLINRFAQVDRNGNDEITIQELESAFQRARKRR